MEELHSKISDNYFRPKFANKDIGAYGNWVKAITTAVSVGPIETTRYAVDRE